MSETQPLTAERRRNVIRDVAGKGYGHTSHDMHRRDLREYEATVCQVETRLAKMTEERDALRTIVDWHYSPTGLARLAKADLRKLSPARRLVIKAARVLSLPEVTP